MEYTKKEGASLPFFAQSIIFSLLFFVVNPEFVTAASPDPNFYYYSSGRKNTLPLSKEMIAVRFKQVTTLEQQETIVESEENLVSFSERKELSVFKITLLPLREGINEEGVIQTIENLNARSEIEAAYPVFCFPDAELILTNEFIVKFTPSASQEEINAFNSLNNVEIARKPQWADWYVLRVKDARNMNTLKTANLYYESPITEFAVPNFIRRLEPMSVIPDDTYFPNQWALNNTGQDPPGGTPDADIDAPEGWEISTGSSDITIAIIDVGVDLSHEDLINKLVDGYDFVDDGNDPNPIFDEYNSHGTACAGLAAAETNNGKGVAGVSWNCKIMPIRIAYNVGPPWGWITSDEWLAGGIGWASDNGADVLSNSWGSGPDSDTIHNAIIDAKNNGRNGRGCVIVFASGNVGGPVAYPAKYSEVVAVGATDEDDVRWNYSNYGNELDVVAPSGNGWPDTPFWTTDITGSAGYNLGDYHKWFNGTSAAAPQVAGLAALILSVNPFLTSGEVQSIIESTTDDKGDPGWDQYYGYGRINIHNALIEAGKQAGLLAKADDLDPNDSVSPADSITYTISFENNLKDPNDPNLPFGTLTNVTIVDTLPEEVDYEPTSDPNYDPNNHTYTWNIGTVEPNDSNSVTLMVTVNELAVPSGTILNISVIDANEILPVTAIEITDVNAWVPDVIYVDKDASEFGTGLSWEKAFTDLQDGLEAAETYGCKQIWVAAANEPYAPTTEPNLHAAFHLINGVALYGGFPSGGGQWAERDPAAYETVLTADIDDDGDADVHYVVKAIDVNETAVIDGFTITRNGWAGIRCENNASPTIRNNKITETSYTSGSGIDCDHSDPNIINCIIEDNDNDGIHCNYSNPTIINCIIQDNDGDGIYCEHSGPKIINCRIKNNNRVGIHRYYSYTTTAAPEIIGCTIEGNGRDGIRCQFESTVPGTPVIKNNLVYNNAASGSSYYAIYLTNITADTVIRNNTVVDNATWGIVRQGSYQPTVSNCIIWGNTDGQLFGCSAAYCCVEGGYTGEGNISTDPCFVDDANDNYHLSFDSNCIDAGDPNFNDSNETDIDGQPRNMGDCNETVDIGADEVYFPPCWNYLTQCHADADDDNDVDTDDFCVFKDSFGTDYYSDWNNGAGPYNPCADYDRDGDVDTDDFIVFKDNFGEQVLPDCNCGCAGAPCPDCWPPECGGGEGRGQSSGDTTDDSSLEDMIKWIIENDLPGCEEFIRRLYEQL